MPGKLKQRRSSRDAAVGDRRSSRGLEPRAGKAGDASGFLLLVVLYAMQGVPLGLTLGSMPFLLQARASFTAIGVFSLASYPYSFKLFWSPIVDSLYLRAFGRRKSWVVPVQLLSAASMIAAAPWAGARLAQADIPSLTALFFWLVLLAATQDIAVDGWALTLLSPANVGYAATCQTVGMNAGYFASFTVFLALNDRDFCSRYLGWRAPAGAAAAAGAGEGWLTLGGYMRAWGWAYLVITLAVAALKRERSAGSAGSVEASAEAGIPNGVPHGEERDGGWGTVVTAYRQLLGVMRLPALRRLGLLLLTFRLGMLPAEQAAPLKLLEKGVSKEALAGLVLAEFPCELVSALVAGRWAAGPHGAARPWLWGYALRLACAAAVTTIVYRFPADAASLSDHPGWFAALAGAGLATSFTSTLMFTALGGFFNRVSDPAIGGAYLTLLNTVANMGLILPKLALFALMDGLTVRSCVSKGAKGAAAGAGLLLEGVGCGAGAGGGEACAAAGGECRVERDGFYRLSYACVGVGALLLLWLRRALPYLEGLPLERWRAKSRQQ